MQPRAPSRLEVLEELERRFDGPIPAALKREQRALSVPAHPYLDHLQNELRLVEAQTETAADRLARLRAYGRQDVVVDAAARELARLQAVIGALKARIALESPCSLRVAAE